MAFLDGSSKRGARRGVPIHCYVGANGGGKSLAMVHDTLPSLQQGRPVISNMGLLDSDGEPHPLWVPLRSWVQLLEAEHCDVLLDEAQGVVNSRESSNMPVQMLTMLMQLRKRDVCLRLTAPNFARVDKAVREVCQAVTVCKGYMATPQRQLVKEAASCEACALSRLDAELDEDQGDEVEVDGGEEGAGGVEACEKHRGRLWSMKRLFWWRTYDAMEWEQFSLQQVEGVKPLATQWYWRPGRPASTAYDTLGQVEVMDHLSEAGLCAHCGGKRRHRACECVEHAEARPQPRQRRGRALDRASTTTPAEVA